MIFFFAVMFDYNQSLCIKQLSQPLRDFLMFNSNNTFYLWGPFTALKVSAGEDKHKENKTRSQRYVNRGGWAALIRKDLKKKTFKGLTQKWKISASLHTEPQKRYILYLTVMKTSLVQRKICKLFQLNNRLYCKKVVRLFLDAQCGSSWANTIPVKVNYSKKKKKIPKMKRFFPMVPKLCNLQ